MLSNILFILLFTRLVRSAIGSTNIGPVDMEPGFRVRFYESTLPEKPTDAQVKDYLSSQQYVSDGTLLGQLNGITETTVRYNRYHDDFIHGFYIDPDEIKQFVVEFRGYFKWDKNGILRINWQSPLAKACDQKLFRTTGTYIRIYPDTYLDTSASNAICLNDYQLMDKNNYIFSGNMTTGYSADFNLSKYVVGMWYPIIISVYNAGDGLDGEFMYAISEDPFNYFSVGPENSGHNPNDNYPYFDANRKTNPVAKRCPVFDADNYVEPQVPPPYVTTAYTCPNTETSSTVIVPTTSSSSESIVESSSSALPAESSSSASPVESSSSEWSGESTLSESIIEPTSSESSLEPTSSESVIEPTSSESVIEPTPSESIIESAASTTSEYASSVVSSVVTTAELTEDQSSTDIETDSVPTPQPSSTGPSDMSSVDSFSTAYSSLEFSTAETETSSNTEEPQTATTSSVSSDFHSSSIEDIITSPEWTSMTSEISGPTETSTPSSYITDHEAEESSTTQSTTTNTPDVPTDLSSTGMKSSSEATTIATISTPTHPTPTGDKTSNIQTVGTEIGTSDGKSLNTDKFVTVTEDSNGGVVTTTIVIRPGEGPEGGPTHTLSDDVNGGEASGTTMAEAGGEQKPSGGNVHASTNIDHDGNPEYMPTGGLANHRTTTLRGTDDHANSPTKGTSTYEHANNAVDDVQPNETSFAGPSDKTGSTGTTVSLASYKTVTTATNTHPVQLEEFVGQASSYTVWSSLLVLVASFALF